MEILEAAGESAAVLVHHVLAAGREALRLSAVSEAIIHFERTCQLVHDAALPEMPSEADLRDEYLQLGRAYELAGQTPFSIPPC